MQTIRKIDELTADELRRIRNTLARRYAIGTRGNIVQVGFGIAEQRGDIDADRMDAICFYVTRKRTPRSRTDRIPTVEQVRVKRRNKFLLVQMPTDVLEVNVANLRVTGRQLWHLSGRDVATAGAVVVWRIAKSSRFQWGVITAGHLFHQRPATPESRKLVRMLVAGNRQIEGRLILRSSPADEVDAALVSVQRRSLVMGGVIPTTQATRSRSIRKLDDLIHDRGQSGITLSGNDRLPFVVLRYLPVFDLVEELGDMRHFLDVRGELPETFAPGNSGSLWVIARQAACHQSIGWYSHHEADNFLRGGGQSIAFIFQWIRRRLARRSRRTPREVDLRLVRHL